MNALKGLLLATTALVSTPFPAHAFCGFYAGKADATLFNSASQVVIARDGRHTVLSMVNDYQGPLSEFALVVPTPVVLHEGQVRIVDRAVFDHLDAYSSPRLAEYFDADPCRWTVPFINTACPKARFEWDTSHGKTPRPFGHGFLRRSTMA
jgi:hypothetical protein